MTTPPVWDLPTHFGWTSWEDPELGVAVNDLERLSRNFNNEFSGQLKTKLGEAIKKYEEIETIKSKISTFLHLSYDTDQLNADLLKFKTTTSAKMSQ